MRVAIPDRLYVGNIGDARSFAKLAELGITAIVDLAAGEVPLAPPRDWVYCRIPLLDGEGNPPSTLRLAVNTVAALIDAPAKTLVACSMGMSRSLAISAAAMAQSRHQSPESCLAQVAGEGPADVSPRLWRDVIAACFESSGHE